MIFVACPEHSLCKTGKFRVFDDDKSIIRGKFREIQSFLCILSEKQNVLKIFKTKYPILTKS